MLVDAGVSHVIIGHSERRMYFNESNTVLNLKLHKALEHDISQFFVVERHLNREKKGLHLILLKNR